MPHLASRLLAATLLLAGPAAHAEYSFAPYETRETGSWADAAAVGDVDGDGRDDVVLTTTSYFDETNDHHIFVYLQQADGTLADPLRFPYPFASRNGLAIGNLDSDPAREIVVGHGLGLTIIDWDQQRGQPVVRTDIHTRDDDALNADDVALLDADRDGVLDIVAHGWSNGARLYMGDGQGGVRATIELPTPAQGYNDLDAGDFNGDGHQDFVVLSGQGEGNAYVYLNNGTTSFSKPAVIDPYPAGYSSTDALGVGDFNADGRDDLAIMRDRTEIALYVQTAAGTLVQDRILATGWDPNAMLGHDLDLDGLDDLLIQHGSNGLGFHLQGPGGLGEEQLFDSPYATWLNTQGMGVGDIDSDGCPDVAVANYNYGLVLHRGQGCNPVSDLALDIRLGDGFMGLELVNRGERNAEDVETTVTIAVTHGQLDHVAVPCSEEHRDATSVRFTCTRAALASNLGESMHVPLTVTAHDRRSFVSVSAVTTTLTPEVDLANNADQASRKVDMSIPARAGRKAMPARTSSGERAGTKTQIRP